MSYPQTEYWRAIVFKHDKLFYCALNTVLINCTTRTTCFSVNSSLQLKSVSYQLMAGWRRRIEERNVVKYYNIISELSLGLSIKVIVYWTDCDYFRDFQLCRL